MSKTNIRVTAAEVLQRYIDEDLPEFVELSLHDVNQKGNFGNTPLHVASIRGRSDEVEALLQAGADVNTAGEQGNHPLHEAVLQGHLPVVEQLLKAGADVRAKNAEGRTARDLALSTKRTDIVTIFDAHRP